MVLDIQKVLWPGWETVRVLGRGSFGAVYEIQRDVLGSIEKAALKVISIPQHPGEVEELYRDGYDKENIADTFRAYLKNIVNEYSIMRQMNGCSNIVHCDDVRYIPKENGIGWDIYIKMELLTPLSDALPVQISEKTVIQVGKDICRALEICAKHNIVHRDIKPQNMFCSANGDYKLGDFGIAKTVGNATRGTVIGTFKYMAPEVYGNRPYGAAADIYSLGLVLYWMLNHRRLPFMPLPPAQLMAGADGDAANRRLMGEPIPAPVEGSLELQRIVLKACAYDPAQRYASASEMLRDLERMEHFSTSIISSPVNDKIVLDEQTIRVRRATNVENGKEPTVVPVKSSTPKHIPKSNFHILRKMGVMFAVVGILLVFAVTLRSVLHSDLFKNKTQELPQSTQQEASTVTITKIIQEDVIVSAGVDRPLALRKDGTVVTTSRSENMESTWTDIVAVSSGKDSALGLRADGTVVSSGTAVADMKYIPAFDVSKWRNIVAVGIGSWDAVGLKSDGTVVQAVYGGIHEGTWDLSGWTDITAISVCDRNVVGLKTDGTVVADGYVRGDQLETWEDIVSISCGNRHVVGLQSNGTVLSVGMNTYGECDVSSWKDIVAVSAGNCHTVGLRKDGTVVAVGVNGDGQCNVSNWENIVAISAGDGYTIGIKSDGTAVAVGFNKNGQCNVSGWYDIGTNEDMTEVN